ncbi:hypothetical protein V1477_017113 [Vespula maculifrons]|uniref:Uncharacterized protein n=1 Tax=Vespula maculifrons TaxID=7453 RepID=A0ABD2B529_VESMC
MNTKKASLTMIYDYYNAHIPNISLSVEYIRLDIHTYSIVMNNTLEYTYMS